jgi:hypothetical protein
MKLGDAFTMAVPPRYDTEHLFFVISDPIKNAGTYHIVNITTDYIRGGKDCILNVGDHPWIKRTSYVAFRDAVEITTEKNLDSLVGKLVTMQVPLRIDVLARIVSIAKTTKGYRDEFKKYL